MSSVFRHMKHTLLRYLPESLLAFLKQRHYLSVVRDFPETEEPDLSYVKKLLGGGEHVWDVGANIGVYTKFLSNFVGSSGSVESFEPIPSTFRYLQSNVRALGLSNVRLHQRALSDARKLETMSVPNYEEGGSNFYQASLRTATSQPGALLIEVQTETIDAVWQANGKRLSFLKIDVEGAELACIRGGKQCLATDRPALLIEVSGNMANEESEAGVLRRELQSLGYSPFFLKEHALCPWEEGVRSVNYFFLTAEQRKTL